MAVIKCIVDIRESALLVALNDIVKNSKDVNIVLESKALDIGDICFYVDDTLTHIWERKTPQDLASSITDGRFRDQKARCVAYRELHPSVELGFIIEGPFTKMRAGTEPRVRGALCNLALNPAFSVLPTKDTQWTAQCLVNMLGKVQLGSEPIAGQQPVDAQLWVPRKMKTPRDIFMIQLLCLPGIGNAAAVFLSNEFECMHRFMTRLSSESDAQAWLANVKINKRVMGQNKARVILETLGIKEGTEPLSESGPD